MEEELETMRLGLAELRDKYDASLRREIALTTLLAKLRHEKQEAVVRAEQMKQRHERLANQLASIARVEVAHV